MSSFPSFFEQTKIGQLYVPDIKKVKQEALKLSLKPAVKDKPGEKESGTTTNDVKVGPINIEKAQITDADIDQWIPTIKTALCKAITLNNSRGYIWLVYHKL